MSRVKSVSYFIFLIVMLSLVEVHSQGCVTQSGENCEPTCKSNCTNGYCKLPNECVCNPGYTKRNGSCEPLCEGGCWNGTCTAPNTCRCDTGYNPVNGTCQPVCTEPCENGTCTAPETCECNRGYYRRTYWYPHTTSCEPHCPVGCPLNGYCEAPGRCKCNPGWRMSETSQKCEAICRYPCGNGKCVSPDRCLCAPGYIANYSSVEEADGSGQVCKQLSHYGIVLVFPINTTSKEIHQSSNSNESSTTTTRDPLKISTYNYYNNHDENSSTTTTVSYSVGSSSSTDMVFDDAFNVTSAEKSWMQQHGMYIWIPLVVVVTAGIILLLVWQRIPMIIVNFFKRRSYNVQGAFLKRRGSGAYKTLHIKPEERETQCL